MYSNVCKISPCLITLIPSKLCKENTAFKVSNVTDVREKVRKYALNVNGEFNFKLTIWFTILGHRLRNGPMNSVRPSVSVCLSVCLSVSY